MALMSWDKSYSVGIQQFDEEHQKLISLLNSLHEAMRVGKGRDIINSIVAELQNYTKVHFAAEEALMTRTKYPELPTHRAEHQKFVMQVDQFRKKLADNQPVNTIDVMNFVRGWLSNHIQQTDRAYGPHLRSCGIS